MPHAHTDRVLETWRRRRAPGRRLPERTAISPLLFGPLLPQMFVLAETDAVWRFRTAGGLLEDLHGRPLAGEAFTDLWTEGERPAVAREIGAACVRGEPWVAACRGETARGRTVLLELTLAPLTGPFGDPDRVLGLYQPLSPLARLQDEPLRALRLAAPAAPSGPRLVVDNTRLAPLG